MVLMIIFAFYLDQIKVKFMKTSKSESKMIWWYQAQSKKSSIIHLSYDISLTGDTHPGQVFNLILCSDLSIPLLISSKLDIPQVQDTAHNAQQILPWKQQAEIRMMEWTHREVFVLIHILGEQFVSFSGVFVGNTFTLNWFADFNRKSQIKQKKILKSRKICAAEHSHLHLTVIEADDRQGSPHDLPLIFVIYGTHSCTVTLKRHSSI